MLQSMLFSRVTLGVIIGSEVRCEKNLDIIYETLTILMLKW